MALGVAKERQTTDGRVAEAGGVGEERRSTDGRVRGAGGVAIERLEAVAVLDKPVVLLKSENQPCAVLSDPVVFRLSACTFSAALFPLPRSSVGCFAWATGEAAKQASTSRIVANIAF